ncbi:hypothetical protein V5F23_14885 [Pseudomonas sp. WP18]|uniref:hypothetical protein n=1 Tax=unclassified Pseudomonas TaxID=196821 RepID=UPI001BB3C161|nr:hypothetical protein [Pseudomonas sp. Cab53]
MQAIVIDQEGTDHADYQSAAVAVSADPEFDRRRSLAWQAQNQQTPTTLCGSGLAREGGSPVDADASCPIAFASKPAPTKELWRA